MAARKQSETTIKTRAFRRWVDADAKAKKAENAVVTAKMKYEAAAAELKDAADECRKLGVPISG